MSETYQQCTVAQWEKKAELALVEGDVGQAMTFAHYANRRETVADTSQEGEHDG